MAPQQYGGYPVGPTPKKANGLLIGLVIGAVVLVGGVGIYLAVGKTNTSTPVGQPSSLSTAGGSASSATAAASSSATAAASPVAMSLPASAGGLVLLTTPFAKQEADRVRTGVSRGGAVYANALIGSYGPKANGDYRMVLVAQPYTNLSTDMQSQFTSLSPASVVSEFVSGTHLTDVHVESSSDSNAAITCGTLSASNVSVLTCIWDDAESFGLGYFYNTYFTTGISAAAHYTDALRAAAEGS